MSSAPIISVRDLHKTFRSGKVTHEVLHGVSLEVQSGELVAIVGTSGSGKTTLLNIIGGLESDYRGEVVVAGERLDKLGDRRLSKFRNRTIGFVFQQFNLLEHLSLKENVALPGIFARGHQPRQRAVEALERVGLGQRVEEIAANLSGGQKQRVAIARALYNRPSIVLCDEPTGNLDTATGERIIDLFRQLNRDDRITLVIVTHESRMSRVADRTVRMEDGVLRDVGSADGAAHDEEEL